MSPDYAQENADKQAQLESELKQPLKVIVDTQGGYQSIWRWFVCTSCGGEITAPNLFFFDLDVRRVKCYGCQEANKH